MKLLIPEIGDKLILSKDWIFTLYAEYRNEKLYNFFTNSSENIWNAKGKSTKAILFKGTGLIVDRIYIRKGACEYSSVSFRIDSEVKKINKKRFWAKLNDVNEIEFEEIEEKQLLKNVKDIPYLIKGQRTFYNYSGLEELIFKILDRNDKHIFSVKVNFTFKKVPTVNKYHTAYEVEDVKYTLLNSKNKQISKSETRDDIIKEMKNEFK